MWHLPPTFPCRIDGYPRRRGPTEDRNPCTQGYDLMLCSEDMVKAEDRLPFRLWLAFLFRQFPHLHLPGVGGGKPRQKVPLPRRKSLGFIRRNINRPAR